MKALKTDYSIYLLLLIAFAIRLPGVMDGIPAVYNSTEYFLAKMALNIGAQKSLDPGFYIYPTLYTYFLFIQYGFYFALQSLIDGQINVYTFAIQFLIDPSVFYLLSRFVNVIIALFTIYVFWHGLKKYCSESVAIYSTLMMTLSTYMIEFSGYATADILMVFFSSLTIIYFYRLFREPTPGAFFLTGFFTGLSIAAKYNAGFLAAGLLIAVYNSWRLKKIKWPRNLGFSVSGILLGFLLTNPLWLIYPQRFYQGFKIVSAQMFSAISVEKGLPFLWETETLIGHELVIGVVFLAGMFYYFFNGQAKHAAVLAAILLTFLYVGTWSKKGIDYLFAVYPAWMILGGYFLADIIEPRIALKHKRVILISLVFLPSILAVVYLDICLLNDDTRETATHWLITHVDKEAKICYDNTHYDLGVYDIDRFLKYGEGATKLPAAVKDGLAAYKEDKRRVHFVPILIANPSCTLKTENPYETEVTKFRRRSLNELIKLNVDYLITNRWFYDSYLTENLKDYPLGIQIGILEVQEFYHLLGSEAKPLKTFKADFWTRGPEIQIYDLRALKRKTE